MERGWKPNVETSPNCQRCGSSNTKFCYYNNYSLTQPRYFCKSCRRYWTKGGSLRNVPVGGGCRKNRSRSKPPQTPSSISPSNPLVFSSPNNRNRSPDIDLAIVYANFLNQKPPTNDIPEKKQPSENFEHSSPFSNGVFGSSSFCNFSMQECAFGVDDQYFGFGSSFECKNLQSGKTEEDHELQLELPPFPGEEMAGWTSSLIMVNQCQNRLQQTRVHDLFGVEGQDPNLVGGNWSPVDLSTYDSFSRA